MRSLPAELRLRSKAGLAPFIAPELGLPQGGTGRSLHLTTIETAALAAEGDQGNNHPAFSKGRPMIEHPSSALVRGTIFVRDIDRASAFYRAIGLTETYFDGRLSHPSATAILGFDDPRPFDIRIVKRPGPNYGMIGLFKLAEGTTEETIPVAKGPARIGEVALVFYVTDLAATMERLCALGATWAPEPQIFAMEHRAQLEVCIRDCDGVLINLVETDPAQQERTRPELDYA